MYRLPKYELCIVLQLAINAEFVSAVRIRATLLGYFCMQVFNVRMLSRIGFSHFWSQKSNAPICFQCGRLLVYNCCLSACVVWKLHVSVMGKACVTNFLFTSTSTLLQSIFGVEGFGLSLTISVSYWLLDSVCFVFALPSVLVLR